MSTSNRLQYHFDSELDAEDTENPQKEVMQVRRQILVKIEKLSEKYINMKKAGSFLLSIAVALFLTIFFLVAILIFGKRSFTETLFIAQLVFGTLLIVGCISAVVVIFLTYPLMKVIKYLSGVLWCIMMVGIILGSIQSPFTVTTVLSITIILLYVVFPVPILWSVIGGFAAIVAHGCLHIRDFEEHGDHFDHYIIILTELGCVLAVNVFGAYIKLTTNGFHSKTFLQTYEDLKARIELQKEREKQEQLLLSIIPADLAFQMRQSMVDRLKEEVGGHTNHTVPRRLWHDFYIREHKQVSILFADLVNFTELTTKCSAKDLVSMLNEIYGRFDGISRLNDSMRIKTLGDCYCCVSGMPVSRPHHAENVVKTALQMVQAIKSIRDSTTSILDMRIGVHTGNVLCGVLGTVKWKYDIWSEDVAYANFLEATGVPGKVHISKTTMLQLPTTYAVEAVSPPVINAAGEPQETYLISELNANSLHNGDRKASIQRTRSFSSASSTQQLYSFLKSWGAPKPFENLAIDNVIDDTTPKRSYEMLEASADSEFFSQTLLKRCDPRSSNLLKDICCCKKREMEDREVLTNEFIKLKSESAFGLSITLFIYFFFNALVNCVIFPEHYAVYIISGFGLVFLPFIIYFYLEKLRNKNKRPSQIKYNVIPYYSLLAFGVAVNLSFLFVIHYDGLPLEKFPPNATAERILDSVSHSAELTMLSRSADLLLILPIFAFKYARSLVKLLVNVATLVVLCSLLLAREAKYYYPYRVRLRENDNNDKVIPAIGVAVGGYLFLSVTLLLYSRQMENSIEALILWKQQFRVETVEVETMRNLTKLLLMNILPQHVATYYLDKQLSSELYHESYDNACIMFATVVNFDEFFKMSSNYDREHQCLRLLNEIIGDFDMLLSKPKYSAIEKMKTVGSTYMAAAGLQPGRDITTNGSETFSPSRRTPQQHVQAMTEFALAMFTVLDTINKHSFNNFRLRIGMSHGPVIAGVVGAQKPQYDVWGDTVNMASRMDSGGIIDQIQMTEKTGELLVAAGYPVVCRGKTVVKGKHELITTYLLQPPNLNKPATPLARESGSESETRC